MRYIVDFKDHLTLTQIDQHILDTLNTHNIRIIKQFPAFGNAFLVEADLKPELNELIESVVDDENNNIQLLGLDIVLPDSDITTTFDIEDTKNWWKTASINPIDFDEPTYTHTVRGFNSTVYIMDSGIEATHPEFVDTTIVPVYSFTNDFTDTKGHGTALASLISGKTCGLTGATLKIVKIFDANVPTKQSDMLAAFDAIAADYVASGKPLSVINMSWGFAKNDYINAKIEQLANMGLFLVAAAGNAGVPIDNITPASILSVFTVGAYDETLKPCDFSNYTGSIVSVTTNETNHGELDGWAPGANIWSAALNGSYGFAAGTSQAAAIASGALAYNLSNRIGSNGLGPEKYISYSAMLADMRAHWKPTTDNSPYDTPQISSYENLTPYVNAVSRPNLLDLSDPKYANSFNTVITYKTGPLATHSVVNVVVTENTTKHLIITDRVCTSRITTTHDIPSFITIDENGILTVVAPAATQPASKIVEFPLELHQRDGSTNTFLVGVYLLSEAVTKETAPTILPANDPILNIVLYYTCINGICGTCTEGWGCDGPYTTKSGEVCYGCYQLSSDMRLKENINKIDTIDGINIYSYSYIWDKTKMYKGAMAQELLLSEYKDSVFERDGYYMVDISKLPETIRRFYLS